MKKEEAKDKEEGGGGEGMRMTVPSPNHAAALKSTVVTETAPPEPSGGFYHLNDNDRRQHGALPSHQTQFALDCYVKNRIVEAMRTEDEKRSDSMERERELREIVHMKQQQQGGYGKMEVVVEKSGGGAGEAQEEPSGVMMKQQNFAPVATSVTSYSSSAYPYPFSALNVASAPATSISTVAITKATEENRPAPPEPKPLLSAQYEELSDEE